MWWFTDREFTSTVLFNAKKDLSGIAKKLGISNNDKNHLLIRTRTKADLENIQKDFFPDMIIDVDDHADYAYRAVLTKAQMKTYACAVIDAIDYDSHFKEVHSRRAPKTTPDRHETLMSIWTLLAKWQPGGAYSAYGGTTYYGTTVGKEFKNTTTTVKEKTTGVQNAVEKIKAAAAAKKAAGTTTVVEPPLFSEKEVKNSIDEMSDEEFADLIAHYEAQEIEDAKLVGEPVELDPETGFPREKIHFSVAREMMLERGTDDLLNSEVNNFTEPAFELYCMVMDRYPPSRQPITESQMAVLVEELLDKEAARNKSGKA